MSKNEKNLIIEVTEARGFQLPPASSSDALEHRGLLLLPGENQVTADYWQEVRHNPAVKIHLRAGTLVNRGTGVATPLATDWAKIKTGEAKTLIAQIKNIDTLRHVKTQTTKKSILAVCEDRIDALLMAAEAENA